MKIKNIISAAITCVLAFNTIAVAATTGFEYGSADEAVSKTKKSSKMPYVGSLTETKQFYYNNDLLDPVFRIKFDEGSGNTVTESVSGKTAQIIGEDYEWIHKGIRYGASMPVVNRQNSALRLKNSYIDLGTFEDIDITGEITIVFWTNYEIFGRNEDYVEPEWLNSQTHATYNSAYKYDKNILNVILQSDNMQMGLYNKGLRFYGIDNGSSFNYPNPLICNDYYNMYMLTVKQNSDGDWIASTFGNDCPKPETAKKVYSWGTKHFGAGNIYIGTPNPTEDGSRVSCQLGIADLMIFDRAITYQEQLMLYYGYNQTGYVNNLIPTY